MKAMKKYIIYSLAILAGVACAKQEINNDEGAQNLRSVIAEFGETITKADFGTAAAEQIPLQWTEGDKVGIYATKSGSPAMIQGTISISGDDAIISYDATDVTTISAVWYPYDEEQTTDLTVVPTAQDYSVAHVWIPLKSNPDIADTRWTFDTYIDYSVIAYRLKKGNADRTLKSISANGYALSNINVALTNSEQKFYLVVPASGEAAVTTTFVANDGASDLTYTRTKSAFTATSGKVTAFPLISDLDETGKALWTFGKSHSSTNATLAYWGQWHRTTSTSISDVANASYDSFATITTQPANDVAASSKLVFRANFGPINNFNYSSDGSSIVYNTDITLPVHPGNYPIFAVKMTNPNLLGDTKRNFCLIVSDKNGNYVDKKLKNADNQQNYLPPYSSTTKGPVVMYYDFCTEKIGTSEEPLKNTVATLLKRLNIQFADITYSSAQVANPTFEICWAGFFNSLDELRNYDKIGFYADRMDADAALWTKGQDGTVLSIGESNGEKYVNVVPQNNTNSGRGDIKRSSPVILSRDYPILVFRVDDLNDKADETNVAGKRFSRNINIDVVGIGSDTKSYSGNLGGINNQWSKKYKCSDGSSILVYNLETQAFSNGGILPEDVTVSFTTFQIKYADIKNSDNSNIKDIAHLSYRFFGFHTFKSMSDLSTYLNDWSTRTSITYSE